MPGGGLADFARRRPVASPSDDIGIRDTSNAEPWQLQLYYIYVFLCYQVLLNERVLFVAKRQEEKPTKLTGSVAGELEGSTRALTSWHRNIFKIGEARYLTGVIEISSWHVE